MSKEGQFSKQISCVSTSEKDCCDQEPEDLKSVAKNLLSKSSIFAVAQLVTSSGFGRKILWLVVLLVGLCGCSYEIYRFLQLYFQYPVVITLEVENNWKLNFPAVTVCNLNRIPLYYYECILQNKTVNECINLTCEERSEVRQGTIRPTLMSERQKYASCSKDFKGVYNDRHLDTLIFLNSYLNTTDEERKKLGYSASSFITSCTFNGESCSISNFTDFLSIGFGNCFTFNGHYNTNKKSIQTPYIGPNSGLELTLNLNKADYIPLSSSIGARVVIHEPDTQPNPEEYGINISPQFETSLALRQTAIYRLPYPYRDRCQSYEEQGSGLPPNQEACIRKCMQSRNLEQCGCVDPFLPTDPPAEICDLRNQTAVCCLDAIMKSLSEDDTPCPCPLPCKSTNYEMTISSAEWPTHLYYKEFLQGEPVPVSHPCAPGPNKDETAFGFGTNASDSSSILDSKLRKAPKFTPSKRSTCLAPCCQCEDVDSYDEVKTTTAKVKVFYKTLEKSYYKQEPMFQESELFSQLGGQLGLWLGVSLVALFECVENISHLIHYCIKTKGEKEKNNLPSSQKENITSV